MSVSISKSITLPKVSQNVANYSAGLRAFLPENQNCPTRTLTKEGYPMLALDQYGRVAPNSSVQEAGWCGGQFDPQYRMTNEVAIERPQYVTAIGGVNGALNNNIGATTRGVYDTLVEGGIKNNGTRYTEMAIANNPYSVYNPILTATQGKPAIVCSRELQSQVNASPISMAVANYNAQIPLDTKYTEADYYVNLGGGGNSYANYMQAYAKYLPNNTTYQIP
jgi:hypothetical protein